MKRDGNLRSSTYWSIHLAK